MLKHIPEAKPVQHSHQRHGQWDCWPLRELVDDGAAEARDGCATSERDVETEG